MESTEGRPPTNPQGEVVLGNANLDGIGDSDWFSKTNALGSHHREQDPEQRGAEDLVRCGSPSGKHKNRQMVRVERTDHCTPGTTKEDHQTKK